jgi:hypothetical protein
MKDCGTHYEYLATWVDDVLHWGKEPMALIHQLEKIFPLKGTGVPEYYLGGDIEQVKWPLAKSGKTTAISCRTYITQVVVVVIVVNGPMYGSCGLPSGDVASISLDFLQKAEFSAIGYSFLQGSNLVSTSQTRYDIAW